MITLTPIIKGENTEQRAERQLKDFQHLVKYEQIHLSLFEGFRRHVSCSLAAELRYRPNTIKDSHQWLMTLIETMAWVHGYIDFYYVYYYEAYAPRDSECPPILDRVPWNIGHTPDAFTYLEEYLGSMLNEPWTTPVTNKQTICQQIAHHDAYLDKLLVSIHTHDLCARQIDSRDIAFWKPKYDAWVARRQILIQIDKTKHKIAHLKQEREQDLLTRPRAHSPDIIQIQVDESYYQSQESKHMRQLRDFGSTPTTRRGFMFAVD